VDACLWGHEGIEAPHSRPAYHVRDKLRRDSDATVRPDSLRKGESPQPMQKSYEIYEIMNMLPHRYPFILIDRILEIVPGEKVVALKNVTINEPFFQGHFPGTPVMPGVLIVEAMGQAGGVLAFASLPQEKHGKAVYFMRMDKIKFRRPVIPGDQMVLQVKFLKKGSRAVKLAGVATVNEELVSEAEFMATFGEKP